MASSTTKNSKKTNTAKKRSSSSASSYKGTSSRKTQKDDALLFSETSSKSSSRAKKTDASARREHRSERRDLNRELCGVSLIFIGLILGIFCYCGSSGLLAFVAPVLFGLFGIAVYALPILLIVLGAALIVIPRNELRPVSIVLVALVFLCILALIHTAAQGSILVDERFPVAVSDAYKFGADHVGGGVFGGIVSFVFVLLLGKSGAIVALIGLLLILALLITHFSINGYIRHIKELRKERYEEYEEANSYDEPAHERTPRSRRRPYNEELDTGLDAHSDDRFIEHSGKPLTAGDTDYDYNKPRRRRGSAANAALIRETPKKREHDWLRIKPKKNEAELEFFPISGPIKSGNRAKRKPASIELDQSFPTANRRGSANNAHDTATDLDELFADVEIEFGEAHVNGEAENTPVDKKTPAVDDDFLADAVIEVYDPNPSTISNAEIDERNDGELPAEGDTNNTYSKDGETSADGVDELPIPYVYQRPPLTLLHLPDPSSAVASEPPEEKARILIETLNSFGISARVVNISVGPVITRYELQPAQGVRVNRITSLSNDIALALAAPRVRIEAPIPGKSAIGIEIPNRSTVPVLLRELLETNDFNSAKAPLTFALGKDIAGKVVLGDLGRMPHMLVAGQTGAGKSVCINGIILSLVYKSSPKDVRMILIDPKVVELSIFSSLPHLFCPVVTEPKKAAGALQWAVNEMDQRYRRMAEVHARDIDRYNSLQIDENERWPRLVIIIDELADLMIVASKDVEESICRIAQLGRACGIHLIVATQRPSVDVITGLIKANIPSRIAFAVSNGTDSRVILDASGAEKLLGKGDMLFHPNGADKPIRAQGAYVSDEEVEAVSEFFSESTSQRPEFKEDMLSQMLSSSAQGSAPAQGNGKQEDELLPDAVRLVIESGAASISMIQRRLRVGYARAARLIDIMEQKGYVSPADGAKPRRVLISAGEFNAVFGGSMPAPIVDDDADGDVDFNEQ